MRHWILVLVVLGLFSLTASGQNELKFNKIGTGVGPEDMVLDNSLDEPRLLISCTSRRPEYKNYGEIEVWKSDWTKSEILPREGFPEGAIFRPHGVFQAWVNNEAYLYVISHDDENMEHPVFIFCIKEDKLVYEKTIKNQLINSPNALTVLDDGSFLVCNDARKRGNKWEQILGLKTGNIVYVDQNENCTVVAEKLGMPAGMNRIADRIFVSCATGNKILSFDYEAGSLTNRKKVCRIKGPDNIRISNKKLVTTAHERTGAFIKHIQAKENISPSAVYEIDPSIKKKRLIYKDSGRVISAASVVEFIDSKWVIGQIFDSGLHQISR